MEIMMNDRIFDSMSAYKTVSDIIAQTDRIIERNTSISEAIAKSTSFMSDIESSAKYARNVMPMLNYSVWLKNDTVDMYSVAASTSIPYSLTIDYPKLPKTPKWILELNSPVNDVLKNIFATQSNWQSIVPTITESRTMMDFLAPANMFKDLDKASKGMVDVMKISQSILSFNSNIKELYSFINGWEEYNDEYISIDNQLISAIANDIDSASSEGNKISITYVTKYILDTFNAMYENYKTGEDKELFLKWITDFLDDLKRSGVRVGFIKFFVLVVPLLFSIKEILNDDKVSNETVYITESAFETVTTKVKVLKDKPDNRLKVKLTIPIGTKLTILEDKGKWIKVKFISYGTFYTGWTLNNNL
jgi:hypothetical protein